MQGRWRRAAVLMLALAAIDPQTAYAQSCGGSSGDDSGGSSGGGDSSSGYSSDSSDVGSSDAEPIRPRFECLEENDVVGFHGCRSFGTGWNASSDPLRLTIGPAVHWLIGPSTVAVRQAVHEENPPQPYELHGAGLDGGGLLVGGLHLRATGLAGDTFYWGGELQLLFGVGGDPFVEGALQIEPNGGFSLGAMLILGASTPFGPIALRYELALGPRLIGLVYQTQLGACELDDSVMVGAFVVEPRLALDVYLTPWVSLSAYAGGNLVVPGEMSGGLLLSLHARSYDAQRSLLER